MANFRGSSDNQNQNNARFTRESELKSTNDEVRARENSLREATFAKRVVCNHTATAGLDIHLVRVTDKTNPDKTVYTGDSIFMCGGRDGCREIIDMRPFDTTELSKSIFMISSMLQQMKVMDSSEVELSDESREDLRNLIAIIPGLSGAVKTYESMLYRMAGGDDSGKKKNRRKNNSGKGGIGMPSIGGRVYD